VPPISPEALAERRQRIIEAAGRCLDRGGPEAVTARAVAAEAGVSVGALYHHVASLDALWEAVAEQRMVAGITAVAARAPAGEDPLAWAVGALVCAPPVGAPPRPGGPAAEGVTRVVRATLDEVLRSAAATGGLRAGVDREALAEVLELLWDAVDRRTAGGLRTSEERLAAALVALMDGGCRPPPDG
jgi:AcrR family transcriptional regulator